MISFYGGRKGNSFIISKSYDYDNRSAEENSAEEMMINDFKNQTSVSEVNYGDYVLLIHPYSDENGKVYRRVYQGDPEYIGQFMGPKGDSDFCKIFAKFGASDTLDNSKSPEKYAQEKGLSNPEQYIGWMVLKEVTETIDNQEVTFLKLYSYDYYHGAWAITDIRPGMTTEENGEIFNDYIWNEANKLAHAEGYKTKASGVYSHAEGSNTIALGTRSHAEGYGTKAMGDESHAEGWATEAKAEGSHAEGYLTYTPVGGSLFSAAHAEGQRTTAAGAGSHAEGYCYGNIKDELPDIYNDTPAGIILNAQKSTTSLFTLAQKKGSHAEGVATLSLGEGSHAEGVETIALSTASHASGQGTYAIGKYSYAEGERTTASGRGSHIEGYSSYVCLDGRLAYPEIISPDEIVDAWKENKNFSLAYGGGSHVEGRNNLAMGDFSHIEGFNNFCGGAGYSHVEGSSNEVSGSFSHTGGEENIITVNGGYSFVHGKANTVNAGYGISLGRNNTVEGLSSICLGYESETTNEAIESITIGYENAITQRNSITLGSGLDARSVGQIVIGNYNRPIDDPTATLIVGCGVSDSFRANALVVKSGVAMVPGPNNELSKIATMRDLNDVVIGSSGDYSVLYERINEVDKRIDTVQRNIFNNMESEDKRLNDRITDVNNSLDRQIMTINNNLNNLFTILREWRTTLVKNGIKVASI